MTVPPALAALVPLKVAVSVTAVPAGTLMERPVEPPPERVVLRLVDAAGWPSPSRLRCHRC